MRVYGQGLFVRLLSAGHIFSGLIEDPEIKIGSVKRRVEPDDFFEYLLCCFIILLFHINGSRIVQCHNVVRVFFEDGPQNIQSFFKVPFCSIKDTEEKAGFILFRVDFHYPFIYPDSLINFSLRIIQFSEDHEGRDIVGVCF